MRKNYGHLTESELASKCRDLLQEGQIQMDESEVFSKLEGIAKIRFGLVAGAQLLINYIEIKDLENTDAGFKMKLHRFFNAMDAFCSNENYKDGADFLVKVVMKHGKPYLDDIFQSTVYDFYWIYPERLRKQVQFMHIILCKFPLGFNKLNAENFDNNTRSYKNINIL